MQKERGFKKRYVLVPVLFAFILIAWVIHFLKFPVEQEVYKTVKVNNLVTLYITQASAGAMTSFSYHYYLYDATKSEADFMAHIDDQRAFMVTSDSKATATANNDHLYLRVRGDISSFNNGGYKVIVHLDASPY
ncbi:hypothetical protein [Rahnella victoriana]|uniref:Uncharacterized protein n=1 Tax=Rahnella victoriana TaxID=1510570 RepID=A0ABS0DWV8_9GAMM|nr:hypothetical protein [Rahnella victoriana]MBF7958383.1 hypothetical protein [Rahnella victoriana]PBI80432.1 hypothetical protein A9993_12140 [Rahnella victoriana]